MHDPILEHPEIVEAFKKEEGKALENNYNFNNIPFTYTRKREIFGTKELREITIFNMPALISKDKNFLDLLVRSLEEAFQLIISSSKEEILKYKNKAPEFIDDYGEFLKAKGPIKQAAMFIGVDESTFSRALVYHLLAIPMGSSTYNISAIFLDALTIISATICIGSLVTALG